jgi:peptidoglycan hydrolase-like protein with peptidoglycan-binding domain
MNGGKNVREALARSDRDFLARNVEEEQSRLLEALCFILRRPVEVAGALTMGAFTAAILINALAMQNGTHPAPFFARRAAGALDAPATKAAAPSARLGAPTVPPERLALVRDIQTELASRGLYDGLADGLAGPKTVGAIRNFQESAGLDIDGEPSAALLRSIRSSPLAAARPDPIATLITSSTPSPPARSVMLVERALAALGYGPLKVDGLIDADTQAAIVRFEQDRSLPVTGRISARLRRELADVSGIELE